MRSINPYRHSLFTNHYSLFTNHQSRSHGAGEFFAVVIQPVGFALDHGQEIVAAEMAEEAGRRDGQDSLGDHGFYHQIEQAAQLAALQRGDFAVAIEEVNQFCLIEIVGPIGGIWAAAHDGELQHAVGQVGHGRCQLDRIEVEHGRDPASGKEHIARVPIAVHDLLGPGIEAEPVDANAGFVVKGQQGVGRQVHFLFGCRSLIAGHRFEMPAHGGGVVEAPFGRSPRGGEIGEVAMERGQLSARIGGCLGGAVVANARDELEELVDVIVELQDGIVLVASGDERGDGEGLAGQVNLNGVRESHAVGVVCASEPALQEKFALLGGDHDFGHAAIAHRQSFDFVDDAGVVMAEDASQLLRRKMCAASGHQFVSRLR